jgi:hypothetical protein
MAALSFRNDGMSRGACSLPTPFAPARRVRTTRADTNLKLTQQIRKYKADPLGFVLFAFPWGEAGTPLEHHTGPDAWQTAFLWDLGEQVHQRKFNGAESVKAQYRPATVSANPRWSPGWSCGS